APAARRGLSPARLAAAARRGLSPARLASLVLAALLLAALFAAAPARASDLSGAEFRALAREAVDDPAALSELRDVDTVDGQRVDVSGALRGARGEALDARLRQLSGDFQLVPAQRDPRADAREVLAENRFHETEVPGPFSGLIRWLGDRLPNLGVGWLDDLLPGGRSVVWMFLGAILVAVAWSIARAFLTSRVRASAAQQQALVAARDEDPRALERRADAAEAAGDLEAALRLRFRAGLLRLDERGAIEFRPSISTFEVRRTLHNDDFDALAATFDDVVYGGRPPETDDLAAARERWPSVIKDAA
ncbi:DUF4129 domain-containing protein, partial [Solirubrobacter ginsenosidimutans]